jgi:hypothetical protein
MSWIEATPHLQWTQSRSNPGGREKQNEHLWGFQGIINQVVVVLA